MIEDTILKTDYLGIRIPKELKQDLERKAFKQDRSLSNLIVRILREWNSK
ncbi:hypothetical protein LCGC14_1268810 [marine sediment metagenome]|uniref:Arc-like DNA binding domain-containing protein n=1 Tax=marine sediment metagenome TaxID=412755 RepID=A0A0F9LJP2_9ZZZZ